MQINMVPFGEADFGDTVKMFAAMDRAVNDQCAEGKRSMQIYPQKRSSSRYRRTGTLRRSWSSQVKTGSNRIEGEIGSNANVAPYNEQVQGAQQDKLFERIGWSNVDDLQDKVQREFPKRAQDIIDAAFK